MKTNRSICVPILALALWTLAAVPRLHAQMLLNASFENPALPAGSDADGSGANWTASNGAEVFTNGLGYGTTPYGNQWEFFHPGATDAQTVSGPFTLNQTDTFSLVAADVFGGTGDELTITISGGASATQTFALPSNKNPEGALPLATYTLAFTPTSSAAVTFTLASIASGNDIALDNVQIVPEPSARALLALGAAGMLGLALRRRRTA